MKTKTITVNVEEEVEERFRKIARATYGKRKGYLGKAITEAMREWEKKNAFKRRERFLELLEKGVDLGGLNYKKREELHER